MRVRRVAVPVGLGLSIGACCAGVAAYAATATVASLAACQPRMKGLGVDRPAAEAQPLTARAFVVPGEEGTYGLYIRGIRVGLCELRSGAIEQRDRRRVVRVTTVVASDGILDLVVQMRDQVSTLLDADTGMPVETRGSFAGMLTGKPDPTAQTDLAWPFTDHNGHSLLLALRAWDADEGTRAVSRIVVRGRGHQVDLRFAGRELVTTPMGKLPSVRVEGVIHDASSRGEPFHFVMWMADDWTRAILRLDTETDFGEIASARIDDYSAPGLGD